MHRHRQLGIGRGQHTTQIVHDADFRRDIYETIRGRSEQYCLPDFRRWQPRMMRLMSHAAQDSTLARVQLLTALVYLSRQVVMPIGSINGAAYS